MALQTHTIFTEMERKNTEVLTFFLEKQARRNFLESSFLEKIVKTLNKKSMMEFSFSEFAGCGPTT